MRVRVLSVAVGVGFVAFLASTPARAVVFTCEAVNNQVFVSDTFELDTDFSCPLPSLVQVASSGPPADVSARADLFGNTITLSHDRNSPTAQQDDFVSMSTIVTLSFPAPAEALELEIALLFDGELPHLGAMVRLTAGSTVLLDLDDLDESGATFPWTHQSMDVTGLSVGEELVLLVRLGSSHSEPAPAGNIAQLSVTLAPEPGTALLLAGGLGALAARRSRFSAPHPGARSDR